MPLIDATDLFYLTEAARGWTIQFPQHTHVPIVKEAIAKAEALLAPCEHENNPHNNGTCRKCGRHVTFGGQKQ